MSPWAPKDAPETPPAPASEAGGVSDSSKPAPGPAGAGPSSPPAIRIPWWVRVVPFFLSALFFVSALFTVFAPLPILFLYFRGGRRWALLASITNSLVVLLAAGPASVAIYFAFVIVLTFALGLTLERRFSIEKAGAVALASMAIAGAALIFAYSASHHVNPAAELKQQVASTVDFLAQNAPQGSIDPADLDSWRQEVVVEFPSAVAVFSLILVWANLLMVLRLNPGGIREKIGLAPGALKRWRAPEWLVWPALVSFGGVVIDLGPASDVCLNVFKFLMAVYVLQGLSILSFMFDLWNIRGFFRLVGYGLAVFLMMPLLLVLGFFDLWFDFRAKFRQT